MPARRWPATAAWTRSHRRMRACLHGASPPARAYWLWLRRLLERDHLFRFELGNGRSLRLLEETDVDELHALIEANRAYLARWMPWAPGQRREDTASFVRGTRLQLAANNGFQMALCENGSIVGVIGFHRINWADRSASLGYWLAEAHQGAGIMTNAVSALLDHAFQAWDLEQVQIWADVDNRRSRAIPERLVFSYEGVRKHAERVGGRWTDHAVYAMTAQQWHQGARGRHAREAEPGKRV